MTQKEEETKKESEQNQKEQNQTDQKAQANATAPQDEAKTEAKNETGADSVSKTEAKPEPIGKFKDLIKQIESLTTLELAELVKTLEERFGVSAAAPMATIGASPAGAASGEAEAEEKANYTVVLADSGAQKIAVIKALREINQELGLKEAKDIADAPPKEILKDVPKEKAEEAKKKLEDAGAKVELK